MAIGSWPNKGVRYGFYYEEQDFNLLIKYMDAPMMFEPLLHQ